MVENEQLKASLEELKVRSESRSSEMRNMHVEVSHLSGKSFHC